MVSPMSLERELDALRKSFSDILERFASSEMVLSHIASDKSYAGEIDFDIEQTRVTDLRRCQKALESRAAALVIALDEAAETLSASFSKAQSYTGYESFVSIVSRRRAAVLQRMRVRKIPFAGDLEALLRVSEAAMGLLKDNRTALRQSYVEVEDKLAVLITHCREIRKADMHEDETKEHESEIRYARSMRYAALFQDFADALNAQISGLNTLINKLAIDTEQRVVLYRALPGSVGFSSDGGVQLPMSVGENALGGQISELLALYEKKLRTPQDIERRQRLADEAFARRFRAQPEGTA